MHISKQVSKASILNHIHKWKDSGLTKVEYCRLHNLGYSRFKYWCIKKGFTGGKNRQIKASFLPIEISKSGSETAIVDMITTQGIEIIYPNQVRIKLPSHVSLSDIKILINIL